MVTLKKKTEPTPQNTEIINPTPITPKTDILEQEIMRLTKENDILKNQVIAKDTPLALWEIRESLVSVNKSIKDMTRLLAMVHNIEINEDDKEQ